MWSHYASNHTGICLEFTTANSKFGMAYKVNYQEEYPRFMMHESESYLNLLLTKSNVWSYEEEFPLICTRFTGISNHPLSMEGNYLLIGPHALKSLIVGCVADYEAIAKFVRQYAPELRVRRAIRAPNKYRLINED